jgi:hypothetical protein
MSPHLPTLISEPLSCRRRRGGPIALARFDKRRTDDPLRVLQDIYALPSIVPPSPLLQTSSTHFQSASLIIVNRTAGLATGLGIRIGLISSSSTPNLLAAQTDPGFSLAREPSYDPQKAVLLGWVEEERLMELEGMVRSCPVPVVRNPPQGGEVMEWLGEVGRKLEYEGFLSNPEILLSNVLERQ